jgi:hypothetical protein
MGLTLSHSAALDYKDKIKLIPKSCTPIFFKPVLCTVDVLWFLRMEGQRSFRPHSYSIHSQRQKASRSLQFTHSIFTGIYGAYKALSSVRQCQGLGTQKTPLQNAPTPHKISPLGIDLLHMSKISYTFAKSFLRCQSYESELSTMKSKRLEQKFCFALILFFSKHFALSFESLKKMIASYFRVGGNCT